MARDCEQTWMPLKTKHGLFFMSIGDTDHAEAKRRGRADKKEYKCNLLPWYGRKLLQK